MDAGQVLVNAEVPISDVVTFLTELDGYGLIVTDQELLAEELATLGFGE